MGEVASGTKQVSVAIVDNAYAGYLAGPTSITLSTVKITGTLAGGQTGLWILVRQHVGNGDDWTTGSIYLWGACLQQGDDPKKGYARTWAFQAANAKAGVACGPMVISAVSSTDSPLKVRGPGSNLAEHTLSELTAGGELILAGGAGNGHRLAELMAATNPSGWAGMLKVKTPAGTTRPYPPLHKPMTLELDHTQRLNLHALLGAQRGDVATIRALWTLQDRLALTADEEKTLELKREFAGGHERVVWNPFLSIAPRTFDFGDPEIARLRASIESWDGYGVSVDRRWLEPILRALTQP